MDHRLDLSCGTVIQLHEVAEGGRRQMSSTRYHSNGNIKSLPLQERTPVNVGEEILPAERITFYECGAVRRVFPSDGKLSGFWSETQEGAYTPRIEVASRYGILQAKVIYVEFYPDGALASLALWPKERLELPTGRYTFGVRNGIAFYPSGLIQSLEPAEPIIVATPIGDLEAFDLNATGMVGSQNSLCYDENGQVTALVTMVDTLHITQPDGSVIQAGPYWEPSVCSESAMERKGLALQFHGNTLTCHMPAPRQFDLRTVQIQISREPRHGKGPMTAPNCSQ
jgi:hypothetical protein